MNYTNFNLTLFHIHGVVPHTAFAKPCFTVR